MEPLSSSPEPGYDGDPSGSAIATDTPKRSGDGVKVAFEWVGLVVLALIIALLIKTFLFQAFYIPSESMVPTLKVHDRVLVNKLSYKLHPVHRDDIVVFKAPTGSDPGIDDLVKRVIPFDYPLTYESMAMATQACPYDSDATCRDLDLQWRPVDDTLADSIIDSLIAQ